MAVWVCVCGIGFKAGKQLIKFGLRFRWEFCSSFNTEWIKGKKKGMKSV